LRTLIVLGNFLPYSTYGTENLAYSVGKELEKRGEQVSIVCGRPMNHQLTTEFRLVRDDFDKFPVERALYTGGIQGNLMARIYRNELFGESFRRYLRDTNPDRAIVFHFADLSGVVLEILNKLGVKTVLVVTDFWSICPKGTLLKTDNSLCVGPSPLSANCIDCFVREGLRKRLVPRAKASQSMFRVSSVYESARFSWGVVRRTSYLKRQLQTLKSIVVPTNFTAQILRRNGIPRALIQVIPYGLEGTPTQLRKEKTSSRYQLSFGYIGILAPHKGADLLISAFNKAGVEDKARLSIYGDLPGAPNETVHRLRKLAGRNPSIEFRGTFPQSQISQIMASFDVLVVPSMWYENSPLVIQFAFACGVPVLGSDVPGISENVKHMKNGLLFERGNEEQLRQLIKKLVEKPFILNDLRSNLPKPKAIVEYVSELEACFEHSHLVDELIAASNTPMPHDTGRSAHDD
jgi:glycosyltransferase involved in cell wall biosynthesis